LTSFSYFSSYSYQHLCRAGHAAMARAEGAEAGATVVARLSGRGHAAGRDVERRREGCRGGRRLRAGDSRQESG